MAARAQRRSSAGAHLRARAEAKVIWAHTGFSVATERVAALMKQHAGLMGELSYRNDITDGGKLSKQWRALFTAYPDRFLLGSDCWVAERWAQYGEIMDYYQRWLAELPRDVGGEDCAWQRRAHVRIVEPVKGWHTTNPPDTMLSGAGDNNPFCQSRQSNKGIIMVGNAVWFEIPSSNFERAVKFYEAVFQVTLRRENIGGDLAVFPGGEDSVNGAVVSQEGYVPAANGAVVYLNTGDNLQPYLDRVVPMAARSSCRRRQHLPPGMGHYAHFGDTEGNRVGLFSQN